MKLVTLFILLLTFAFAASSQKAEDILATATGHAFRLSDISPEARLRAEGLPAQIVASRTALLEQMINRRVIDSEARALGISTARLLGREKTKVPNPSEADIKTVYDANRTALGSLTLEQARKQIVAFLRRDPEQKLLGALVTRLKTKFKVVAGKDVNAANLSFTDTAATVNGRPILAKEFENFAKIELFELRANLADTIVSELNQSIYAALIADEAKALGIGAGSLIALEITSKIKDYSDEERFALEDAFTKKLFTKYQVKILFKEPEPVAQNISVDDDPGSGPVGAPVTVVMFSDFQCSACSATHPILKKAMAAYPGKIRFVVRDFPLETIHENAFRASLAANAAGAQGKFFEYAEILYSRQDALDDASLKKYAADLGLNVKRFELDFNSAKTAAEIRKDMADGESYGINSTPTIYVNGFKVRNLSAGGFKAAIEKALRK